MQKRAFYTTFEISQICGVNPTTVQNWIKTKRLKAFQTPGRHRRVRREDLTAFLREFGMPIPSELEAGEVQKTPLTILIVDDDVDVGDVIADALQTAGGNINIMKAQNGVDALLMIGRSKPDMIILDIIMPNMNGYDVCERLKANNDSQDIKIIGISGDHSQHVHERIIAAGADMFFTKPLDLIGFRDECFRLLEIP
jgi:excisionase family DNA binding protein